ncbi:MAG: alpha/beta fold hydrolase [Microbacteriaceae bacterium]|nr:alpha/beta fold hydrolase [Microbacteriaceae bacterium]
MSVPTPHADALARIPVREASAEVLGSTTRYWEYGPADAARTVVIVHGYRGDHHGLEPVIARLPGVRIIGPDLPGFGQSTPMTGAPHSIEGYGRWLGAFLDELGLRGGAVLIGHSFGSMVTTHAIDAGLETPALILINPISTDPRRGGGRLMNALTRAYYGAARRLPERVGRGLLGNWVIVQLMSVTLAKTRDRGLRRWIHEEHHRYFNGFSDPVTVAEAFDASLSTDVTRAADALTMPVLIIAGARDTIAPAAGQHVFAGMLPDVQLVMLEGVGHLIHYERPADAADEIGHFLDRLP